MRLNFETRGTGFPLLLLHGLFASLDNWHTISRRLAGSFQVFAPDLRNHGLSPHHDVINYDVMAEDLVEFMETQGLERAHVLGHSMGGKVAMLFALRHPERVGKLIVEDIAPKIYPPLHLELLAAMRALDLTAFQDRRGIDAALAPGIPESAVRQFLLKNITRIESGGFAWKMNLRAIDANYDQLGRAVESDQPYPGPALFIKGGRSEYLPEVDRELIQRLFPQATFHTVPNAGHWVHATAPEAFAKAVLEFLAQ